MSERLSEDLFHYVFSHLAGLKVSLPGVFAVSVLSNDLQVLVHNGKALFLALLQNTFLFLSLVVDVAAVLGDSVADFLVDLLIQAFLCLLVDSIHPFVQFLCRVVQVEVSQRLREKIRVYSV